PALPAPGAGGEVARVGQRRDPPGGDEGGDLDATQAGVGQPGDQPELVLGGDDALLVLQPVARPHLVDRNLPRQPLEHFPSLRPPAPARSEERRVGKECRSGWWTEHEKEERRDVRSGGRI